ncbi:MAG: HAD family hydrolase [Methanomassiliicoccales archaeon]|nr:MAG: HAD family hydrolase [Methanomassiliicoccales archaeon]
MDISDHDVKGIVFDFDGTLVESTIDYAAMRDSILRVISDYGVPQSLVSRNKSSADNIIVALNYLSKLLSHDELIEFEHDIDRESIKIELSEVEKTRPVKGACEAIDMLRDRGIRTGILTRGSREYVEKGLNIAGFKFDKRSIVCRNDHRLNEAKPNPLSMIRAANAIKTPIDKCAYVGDHIMDLRCAKGAGVIFIGVLSGYNDLERWKGSMVDALLNSVAELPAALKRP